MNKTQLQDDLIECNIENLKLRALLEEAMDRAGEADMQYAKEFKQLLANIQEALK